MALILICSMAGLALALVATFVLGCFAYAAYVRFKWEKHGELLPEGGGRSMTRDIAYISMLFDDDVDMPEDLQRQLLAVKAASLVSAVIVVGCLVLIFGKG